MLCQEGMETLEEKVARVVKEEVAVVPYDPIWPRLFEEEKRHLLKCLPPGLVGRIEHFGSTAVPGLPSKPIVDILVEVTDQDETRQRIAPVLEGQGYDYFWRPSWGDEPLLIMHGLSNEAGMGTGHITSIWSKHTLNTGTAFSSEITYSNIRMSLKSIQRLSSRCR
jgi:GrpB-like predicted nucleotidyltransferase (UPF0157 family)